MISFEFWITEKWALFQRLMFVWAGALIIAIVLWSQHDFANRLSEQLVYSYAISTFIWLFSDIGRLALFYRAGELRYSSLSKRKRLGFSISSILLGYGLGTIIGDAYFGFSTFNLLNHDVNRFVRLFLVSMAISVSFMGYFFQKERIATAQRQAAESHLKLLESQLEPHMLFNTLANLRALIKHDSERAVTMLDSLNNYLRTTLSGSREKWHPLANEFARLEDYLALMSIRMGKRLTVTMDCPAQLAQHPIPPLLLQPLVENAIKHGLESSIEGGALHIQAQHLGAYVVLTVSDTGVGGLTQEQLVRGNGFGLNQVRERLASTYGDRARLSLVEKKGYTCTLEISLPWSAVK
jgi:signal transduction histidine kinase